MFLTPARLAMFSGHGTQEKAAAAPAGPLWNSSDKSASVTVSNANLTATITGAAGGVRSTTSHASGKYHVEITAGTFSSNICGFGIASAAHVLTDYRGESAMYDSDRFVRYGASSTADPTGDTSAAWQQSDVLGIEIDLDNFVFRFQSPRTALTSDVSLSGLIGAGPWFLILLSDNSSTLAATFATSNTYTPTAGFGAW